MPGLHNSHAARMKRIRWVNDTQKEVINYLSVLKESKGLKTALEGLSKNSRSQSCRGGNWAPQSKGRFLCSNIRVLSLVVMGIQSPPRSLWDFSSPTDPECNLLPTRRELQAQILLHPLVLQVQKSHQHKPQSSGLTVSRLIKSMLGSKWWEAFCRETSSLRVTESWCIFTMFTLFSSVQSGKMTWTAIKSFKCTPRMGILKPSQSAKALR